MFVCLWLTLGRTKEPSVQFKLVEEHILALRTDLYRTLSKVIVYVERNLGFEAEHHKHALDTIPGVEFYMDNKAGRVGIVTTNDTKHAMATLLNTMLRERRVHVHPKVHSRDVPGAKTRLRDQLGIYSYQYKQAVNTFGTDRVALSGKVGGMKDDLCICLQLGVYWTSVEIAKRQLQQ